MRSVCFVIGPIGKDGTPERKHSDLLLNAVLRHVLQQDEFGYHVKRADEDADPGMIGDRVVSDIVNSDLVVADLTGLNANVFYELGIRHSTEKPTIHVAQSGTVLPFDNLQQRTIFIDLTDWHSIEHARERLSESARAVRAVGYKVSNPITQANASFKMRQSDDPRDRVVAEMHERLSQMGIMGRPTPDQTQEASKIRDLMNQFRGVTTVLRRNGTPTDQIKEELCRLAGEAGFDVTKMDINDNEVSFETSTGGVARFGTNAKTVYWSRRS